MSQRILYVLYNADGTLLGKLKYGYRKLSSSTPEQPACAACDITHGGLSLSESPKWVESKKEIESQNIKVVQWHRDEVSNKLREYLQANSIRYPAVMLEREDGSYRTIMTSTDLNACAGNPQALVEELFKKDVLPGKPSVSSSL